MIRVNNLRRIDNIHSTHNPSATLPLNSLSIDLVTTISKLLPNLLYVLVLLLPYHVIYLLKHLEVSQIFILHIVFWHELDVVFLKEGYSLILQSEYLSSPFALLVLNSLFAIFAAVENLFLPVTVVGEETVFPWFGHGQ